MRIEKTAIYKAQVSTPFGMLVFAVNSTLQDAKSDIISAAVAELRCHIGLLNVKDISKATKKAVQDMFPVKATERNGISWAWVAKA